MFIVIRYLMNFYAFSLVGADQISFYFHLGYMITESIRDYLGFNIFSELVGLLGN
jgi:hypothetical protein